MKLSIRILIKLIILISIFGCNQKTNNKKEIKESVERSKKVFTKKDNFENSFINDSSLIKKIAFDFLKISDSKKTDSLISLCHCQKNKKNNTIKIQLKTAIPTKKELDTLNENGKKWNRLLSYGGFNLAKTPFKGQLKFLNIVLKDSTVKSINLYSKSTDNEYNGIDFDSLSINQYKIKISKFDYSIASNIYGTFELRLDKNFGLFENDTILKGNFLCNNWRIIEKQSIKSIKFKQ